VSDEQRQPMRADDTLSPVDLPGATVIGGHPLRWTSVAIATAAAFLLFLNAATIDDWARELAPGPVTARLSEAAGRWAALTGRLGLGTPRAALHAQWKRGQALRFGGEEGAASPAPDTSPPSP
jgi:hypothetical protein